MWFYEFIDAFLLEGPYSIKQEVHARIDELMSIVYRPDYIISSAKPRRKTEVESSATAIGFSMGKL